MNAPEVSKTLACLMGLLLMLTGLVGFLPNPVIGEEGFFRTNAILNLTLIGFAIALLLSATKSEDRAATGLYGVATTSLGLAVAGYILLANQPDATAVTLFDLVLCNRADVWLLAGTAAVLVACGMLNTASRQLIRD